MKRYTASTKIELHMLLDVFAENEDEVKALIKACMKYDHDNRGLRALVRMSDQGKVIPLKSTYFTWENDPTMLEIEEKGVITKEILDNKDEE
jgi:hypothetical protein